MAGFTTYGEFLSRKFPGVKVQKVSVNAGFSCPNRDGTIGSGGCIYCNNSAFTPSYAFNVSGVQNQLREGIRFFSRKYPEMKYIAYFQSFTNTFSANPGELERMYRSAVETDRVVGLIIGTRPDCVPDDVVRVLSELNRELPIIVELGAESFNDRTLSRINRGHTAQQTDDAVRRLSEAGISVGLHLIFGLPGESREDMLSSVNHAVNLPVETLKFHHMQVIADTPLARMWNDGELNVLSEPRRGRAEENDITLWDVEAYLRFCREVIEMIPKSVAIERFTASAPPELLLAPRWGLKNYQFMNLLNRPNY